MKKKPCRLFGIAVAVILALALWAGPAVAAQIVAKAADASVAYRVYNGYTGTLTWVISASGTDQTNTITCDGNANEMVCGAANGTIAIAKTNALNGITNGAGTKSLVFDMNPCLTSDTTSNMLAGTYTAASGEWLEILWDTSACKHYDLYLPDRSQQKGVGAYTLESVNSVPTGTGNVTASVYKNGTLIKQKVITSPLYVNGSSYTILIPSGTNETVVTNTISFTADANVTLDWDVDLPFTGSEPVIVRVSRATTATTGHIGAVIK